MLNSLILDLAGVFIQNNLIQSIYQLDGTERLNVFLQMDIMATKWIFGELDACFFEVISLFPLFPGNDEVDQVHKIHNILGSPEKALLDNF